MSDKDRRKKDGEDKGKRNRARRRADGPSGSKRGRPAGPGRTGPKLSAAGAKRKTAYKTVPASTSSPVPARMKAARERKGK
jgi:hypothetical protein